MKRGPTVTVWDAIGATGRARLATSRESVSSEILDGRYCVSDNKLLALSKESDGWTRPAVEVDHGVPHIVPYTESGHIAGFRVPTLSAYAIEHAELVLPPHVDVGHVEQVEGKDFVIDGDLVRLKAPCCDPFLREGVPDSRVRLCIHYHDIRDYELLFPQVTDQTLRKGLALFYEESRLAFEARAWLSFAVMAAAVYEGLLRCRFSKPKGMLLELSRLAHEHKLITDAELHLLDAARRARNLVHLSTQTAGSISRTQALDIRTSLDRLVRALSSPPSPSGSFG